MYVEQSAYRYYEGLNLHLYFRILGDNLLETTSPETTPTENTPGDNPRPDLGVLALTDPRRGVLTLTLTLILADSRGRELSENCH